MWAIIRGMSFGFTPLNRAGQLQVNGPLRPVRISLIVPALNESNALSAAFSWQLPEDVCEVILADGGSTDGTRELAVRYGWRVVHAPRGRAVQMNAGAAAASGDVLLFLHADTRLPSDFAQQINRVLADSRTVAGAFRLRIEGPQTSLRFIESLANIRSRLLKLPFGDQALFVTSAAFRRIGGYPEIPIMEDVELVRRLRREGRIGLADSCVITSARRWSRLGVVRTTLLNVTCQVAYWLGASPQRIHRWYYGREFCEESLRALP